MVLKASSIKQKQVVFFEILLERRGKFNNTKRNTQKTGMFFKTLLLI